MNLRIVFFFVLTAFCYTKVLSQQRFDIVIDEIMADPSPQVSLPNVDFIELKNINGPDINLQGWKLSNGSAMSGAFAYYILPADSLTVLYNNNGAPTLGAIRRLRGTGFPALPHCLAQLVD